MKTFTKVVLILAFAAASAQNAAAARGDSGGTTAGIGFDIIGSYYTPTDSRYQGVGTGYALNIKIDDTFTMGYRVEELQIRAEDKVGAANVSDNHVMTLQGLTAFFRTLNTDRLAIDFGLWLGSANSGDLNSAAAGSVSSPFLAPMGRIVYTSNGRVESHASVGVGYRFIRKATMSNPFGAGAGVADLKNFDGLEINFGVGLSF